MTNDQRETFLAAIARHRRASWRVTAACVIAVAGVSVVVAILMSPLLYCLIGLALDIVNFWRPMPDVLTWAVREVEALSNAKVVTARMVIRAAAVASAPGLVLMALGTAALRRVWHQSPLFDMSGDVGGRPPDAARFEEQRLTNVVGEMAIAAGIPVPRVVILPGGVNAAACGRDRDHATLLVGESALVSLPREQLQGLFAHLVGSVVNGDMAIGLRVTTTLSLFGLMARIGASAGDRGSFRQMLGLWRVLVAPTSSGALELLGAVTDPFRDPDRETRKAQQPSPRGSSLTWREWAMMPLMGPVLLTGFLTGMVSAFFLQPLVAVAWRQRKYMADATAVQLTRDPDGLAGALSTLDGYQTTLAPWAAHLAVVGAQGSNAGTLGVSIVPIFPSLQRRIAALDRMGAHVELKPKAPMPWWLVAVLGAVAVIVLGLLGVVVYLLVLVSAALSGLFTLVPAGILHALLRYLAR